MASGAEAMRLYRAIYRVRAPLRASIELITATVTHLRLCF